jgi:hypothetical protein
MPIYYRSVRTADKLQWQWSLDEPHYDEVDWINDELQWIDVERDTVPEGPSAGEKLTSNLDIIDFLCNVQPHPPLLASAEAPSGASENKGRNISRIDHEQHGTAPSVQEMTPQELDSFRPNVVQTLLSNGIANQVDGAVFLSGVPVEYTLTDGVMRDLLRFGVS